MEAKHVVQAVSRHKVLVAAIIVVTLGAAGVGLWLAPKTYEATATVSVGGGAGGHRAARGPGRVAQQHGRAGQLAGRAR